MKNLKEQQKGITLIALVVTIIVLIILAGVSISLVLGDNGIITKSQEARENYQVAANEEQQGLANLEATLGNIGGTETNPSTAKTLVEAFNAGEIKVGDYVNYSDYLNTSNTYKSVTNENGWADQTYSVDTATQWRVLGLSKDGKQLLLTSSSPIKKDMDASSENTWDQDPYLYMKGAYSYVNCVKMLDGISGIYSTSLGTARSMTADDINNILGVTVTADGVYQEDAPTTNIDQFGVLGNTYAYTVTDYTPEIYINSKRSAPETTGETVVATAYFYSWGDLTIDSTIKEILFAGTTSDDNYTKLYWLASPGVCCDSGIVFFGPGAVVDGTVGSGQYLFDSQGGWYANGFAVRPVVFLNSSVTVEDLQVIDGEVETWTYDNSNPNSASGDASTGEAGNHGS